MTAPEQHRLLHIYERQPISTTSVRRLGEALAAGRRLGDAESDWYRSFTTDISDRTTAATRAVAAVLALPVNRELLPRVARANVTGRPKTRKTLIEKLQRTPEIKLPAMHDVAGVRVVGSFTLFEQEQAARIVQESFDRLVHTSRDADLKNRLEQPMFGYRALHLVVWPEGRPVEIQIRTDLQHAWAEIMEKLCDRWGREPRYGRSVNHPDDQERDRRQSIVDQLIAISVNIQAFESAAQDAGVAHVHPPMDLMESAGVDLGAIERAQNTARELEPEFESIKQNLLRSLAQFGIDADPHLDL